MLNRVLQKRALSHAGHRSQAPGQVVIGVGLVMIAAQVIFRGWALHGSYFFTDDYRLMLDAHGEDLTWHYLWSDFDSHVMPLGRLWVWLVTEAGPLNWPLTATIMLVLQLAAGLACLWMLANLFSARWVILAPLALYLTSVLTLPAFMWWAAGLNQQPFQVTVFCSITLWVIYLRSRRLHYLLLTLLSVAIGVGFYEKGLIVGLVLAFLALGYFASGSLSQRVLQVLRTYSVAVVLGAALAGGYLYYYLVHVPTPFESTADGSVVADDIANSMLGSSFPTGLLGGPWQWWKTTPPIVLADPPEWAIHASWVALALVVLYSALRRTRALRGWALLAMYVVALYVVLTVSRGQLYGGIAGLDYRYLTDAICVAALAIGLVFAELKGAVESAEPRADPLLRWRAPAWVAVAVTAAVAVGGLVSSYQYVQFWHHDNASKKYVQNLNASLKAHQGPADLPSQVMPADVMPGYSEPDNRSDVFVPLLETRARFPDTSQNLLVIDDHGQAVPAVVKATTTSQPGPDPGCGWKVSSVPVTIPLTVQTFDWPWWIRIGYLAATSSPVTVSVGGSTVESEVSKGLGNIFVSAPGVYDEVTVSGLEPGTTLCVDTVEVGDPVPSGTLDD